VNVGIDAIEASIKRRLVEICDLLGEDARGLEPDESIPASGLIDSAGLLDLLAWYEKEFGISLAPEEITIDNLGSLRQMAEFAIKRRQSG
jgi:acyl carrier protein